MRYKKLMDLTGRADRLDMFYHAAFFILSFNQRMYECAKAYISFSGIDFETMRLEELALSKGEHRLVAIAHSLFSGAAGPCITSPHSLTLLGRERLMVAITAILISSGYAKTHLEYDAAGKSSGLYVYYSDVFLGGCCFW